MKTLLVIVALIAAGYLWYDYAKEKSLAVDGPPDIKNPYYAEIRASNVVGGREIEMALFARTANEAECRSGSNLGWNNLLKVCPTCKMPTPNCSKELPPRYARLFDDVPIPSAYLSATAGAARERDVRVVIYGLTDQEGMAVCEMMRTELNKNYLGPSRCVAPSGG